MSSPEDPSTTSADSVTPAENGMKRQRTDAGDTNVLPGDESQLTASTSSGPITAEGEMPRKKYYRARAHCNPLSHNNAFDYPTMPSFLDWTDVHYPNHPLPKGTSDKVVPTVLDIGCGFGGLTIALATLMGDKTILGLEIRDKVAEYVRLRIAACRKQTIIAYSSPAPASSGLHSSLFLPDSEADSYRLEYSVPLTGIIKCAPEVPDRIIQGVPWPARELSRCEPVGMPSCSAVALGSDTTNKYWMRSAVSKRR